MEELQDFNQWLGTLAYRHKIIIAGNHDRWLVTPEADGRQVFTNAIYLQNSGIVLEGIHFWGCPANRIEGQWAFNTSLDEQVAMIPEGVDVLLVHSPPLGILDGFTDKAHGGIAALNIRINQVAPQYVIFGHVHEAAGIEIHKGIIYLNVAMQDEKGRMFVGRELLRQPTVIPLGAM